MWPVFQVVPSLVLTFCLVCFVPFVTPARQSKHEGKLRLTGGQRGYMGTVLINHNGYWGSVCDEMWGINEAKVVCRQLGFYGAVKATTSSAFGPGRKRMWMTKVQCTGREARLADCPFPGWDRFTRFKCPGRLRAAGVICSNIPPTTTTTTTTTTTPTTTTTTTTTTTPTTTTTTIPTTTERAMSELELEIAAWAMNRTENILDKVSQNETNVSSNTSSEESKEDEEEEEVLIVEEEEEEKEEEDEEEEEVEEEEEEEDDNNEEEEVDDDVEEDNEDTTPQRHEKMKNDGAVLETETESENEVSEFDSNEETTEEIMKKKAAKSEKSTDDDDDAELLADAPPNDLNIEIRIQGGRYKWEGHLQIRENGGQWGTICADNWTLREAMVACKQVGKHGKAKQALQYSYFGGQELPKTFYQIKCIGHETDLSQCNLTRSTQELKCLKSTSVAGIICSQHLPDLVPNIQALQDSVRLQDRALYYLQCSMEENCLASSAYVIRNTSRTWRNKQRRLMRFSTIVHNRGLADFKPYLARGQWEWHSCHMHYHSMEVFAHYDIMDSDGVRLAEGSKASFCLEDTVCDKGVYPKYNCRGFSEQGLSVNCSDNYMWDIDCQWIDITDIKPGEYTFLMEINPDLLVAESNYENNVISCHLIYNGYFAHLRNCHYENLLDYRRPIKMVDTDDD